MTQLVFTENAIKASLFPTFPNGLDLDVHENKSEDRKKWAQNGDGSVRKRAEGTRHRLRPKRN